MLLSRARQTRRWALLWKQCCTVSPLDRVAMVPLDCIAIVPLDRIAIVPLDHIAIVPLDRVAIAPLDHIAAAVVAMGFELPTHLKWLTCMIPS